jgi:hypothetical protein
MKRTLTVLITVAIVGFGSLAQASDINFVAQLRPQVTCPIRLEVLENPNAGPQATNALFYPGLAHDGNAFKPLIAELFTGTHVRNAIIVHPIGRGGSGTPLGLLFGDVSIDDDAQVLIQSIEQTTAHGVSARVLVLHSMAGLVAGRASQLTSLTGLGIERIVGYALAAPSEVNDPFLESGAGLYLLSQYRKNNAVLGTHVQVTPYEFVGLFFTDYNQQPVQGTPPPGIVSAFDYKSRESFVAAVQTVGQMADRPSVPAGAFANLAVLFIVGSQDIFTAPPSPDVYRHLTGDLTDSGFVVIDAPNAVHDLIITAPALAANASGLK